MHSILFSRPRQDAFRRAADEKARSPPFPGRPRLPLRIANPVRFYLISASDYGTVPFRNADFPVIDLDRSKYNQCANIGKERMNKTELACLKEITGVFLRNREEILSNWLTLVMKKYPHTNGGEIELFRHAFTTLFDDFAENLGNADPAAYYRKNESVAQLLAYNDVPYGMMVDIFHLFEESYFALLFEHLGRERILEALVILDDLHHRTIRIISERYFEVADNTILALAKLVELRDYETGGTWSVPGMSRPSSPGGWDRKSISSISSSGSPRFTISGKSGSGTASC